jgi:CP family cyanate transporter-like MFS transporter
MAQKKATWLVIVGVFLIGANLRLPITMMPPLLGTLAKNGVLPQSLAGWVTTIPLLMFALASPLLGRLGTRYGLGKVLALAAVALVLGAGFRLLPNAGSLLFGTALAGIGITGGNVLLPALIKQEFPNKVAVMTTMYTTAMGVVASLGTGTSGILAHQVGPTAAMAILGSVSIWALAVWLLVIPRLHTPLVSVEGSSASARITQQPLAWGIALYFGLQSLLYYSLLTWLPSIWQQAGFSPVAAGNLATLFQLFGLPLTLLTPGVAERKHGLTVIATIASGGFVIGLLGILIGPMDFGVQALLAIVTGAASGAAFSLCIVFFQKKATTAAGTASLSGMAQSGGYLLAAVGPVGFSLIATVMTWSGVLWLCLVLSVLLGGCGWWIIQRPQLTV